MSFISAPFRRRTWAEFLYALIGLPLCIFGFVITIAGISLGTGLAATYLGLWVVALAVLIGRALGAMDRALLNSLLGERIATPRRQPPARGFWGRLRRRLSDPVGWRALAFQFVRFPLAVATFCVTVTFWAASLGASTYLIWRKYLPAQTDQYGTVHHAWALYYEDDTRHGYWVDTPTRKAVCTIAGIAFIWLTPWIVRGFVALQRALGRALLSPVSMNQRVRDLEESRAQALTAATERLRGIERDLHDGTQARLVALAMNLGQVKEDLEHADQQEAAARVRSLIANAHQQTKDTLAELRDIARGIHPAILDNGLEAALASLASHAPFPVSVEVSLPRRPTPTTETIAYFIAAELLTNAVKHSGARTARIAIAAGHETLRLCVADDGRGGALRGAGSGLEGVAARLAAVDGELELDSPIGGPTVITATLPLEA
jgi:signal transduction histidine kinase